MTRYHIDPNLLREWAHQIAANHLTAFSDAITDPTHGQEEPE